MAQLLNSTVTGNVTVTSNLSSSDLIVGGTSLPNTAQNTVDAYANSGSLQTASKLNFVNTSSMTVTVAAGSSGNANISFVSSGGTKTPLVVTPNTDQNDYNPAGLSSTGELRFNHTAVMKVTGIAAQTNGFKLIINNTTSDYLLWLEHENTSSTAANRFSLPNKFPAFLMPGDTITLSYDTTISRWRVIFWPNRGAGMGLSVFDDFLVSSTEAIGAFLSTNTNVNGRVGWYATAGAGGGSGFATTTFDFNNASQRPMGVFAYNAGTSNSSMWGITAASGSGRALLGNNNCVLSVARFALPNTTPTSGEDFCVTSGLMQQVTNPTQTRTAVWAYRTSSGVMTLYQETQNTSSVVQANTPTWQSSVNSPSLGQYIWHVVFVNSTANSTTFIYSTDSKSFSVANTSTTNLNGASYSWIPAFFRTVDTTIPSGLNNSPKYVHIDFVGYRHTGMVRG